MTRPESATVTIPGPAGGIETVIETPPAAHADAAAVVCHPHPVYHGTMNNKVVHTVARAVTSLRRRAVRFNFRGVGASEGEYDRARGETEDALAVVAWARERWPAAEIWLAGFSFGAAIALRAAAVEHCFALITVAPPVGRLFQRGIATPTCPWLVIQGDADELVDSQQVRGWVGEIKPAPELTILDGVDHFFHGRLTRLRTTVQAFLEPYVGAAGSIAHAR